MAHSVTAFFSALRISRIGATLTAGILASDTLKSAKVEESPRVAEERAERMVRKTERTYQLTVKSAICADIGRFVYRAGREMGHRSWMEECRPPDGRRKS